MMESLEHDLRMVAVETPSATMRVSDDGGEVLIKDVLDDLDADYAALTAARRCMTPHQRAA